MAFLALFSKNSVDYPLMISYNLQCHIGTNLNYLCTIIISIHKMLSFVFSSAELLIISIAICHNCHIKTNKLTIQTILCQNIKMFLPKTLPSFFRMQKKLKTCRNSNLRDFRRSSLGDYVHVAFMS